MKVPEGVKIYGSGRQVFKPGTELPVHMKYAEKTAQKAGDKYAKRKSEAEGKSKDTKSEDTNLDENLNASDKNLFDKKVNK